MKRYYLYSAFIICLFTSCYSLLTQKAYLTNTPNVSFFDSSEVTKMKFVGNLRFLENQVSYPLSDKLGIASDLLFGFHTQYGGDLGLVYYKRLGSKHYFEISSGYGYFNAQSSITDPIGSLGGIPGGNYYTQDINSIYHKLFTQPSFFITNKRTDYGLTLRVSLPYFTTYNCTYAMTHYSGEYSYAPSDYAAANFKNKLGLTIEPMFTIRFKRKKTDHLLQWGMCFSVITIHSTDSIPYSSNNNWNPGGVIFSNGYYYYKNQPFPFHANFFINYAIEFGIGKRKKR